MTDRETAELLKKAVAALEERANAQPCDDAISRIDALNAVTMASVRSEAIENIELIPNTYQKPAGRWIDIDCQLYTWQIKCPFCNHSRSMMSTKGIYPNYCEYCGAKMEV